MPQSEVKVAIISPCESTRDVLRAQVQGLGLAHVETEIDRYCVAFGDQVTRCLVDARPEIVIVDLEDPGATLSTLKILHASLPATWLFVTSDANDPNLIIDAMRSGAREFLVKPVPPRSLAEAFDRFLADRQRHQRLQSIGRLYCVTAVKGGAGATSATINLAASVVGGAGARTAVMDLNAPTGDAASYLNLTPQYTLADALSAASRLDEVLLDSFMPTTMGLSVLAGPRETWAETKVPQGGLSRVLEVLMENHSFTFADVPASLDRDYLRNIAAMSEAVLVIVTSELPALWRAQGLLAFLTSCGCADKVRLVLNRARRGDEVSDNEIEKALGLEIFWRLPNNYNAAVKGINEGVPLVTRGSSDLSRSFRELAGALTGLQLAEKRRGLFGMLSLATGPSNA